ncbi:alkyl sulfatase dimerization domain-containing protein [Streptomyces sp. NPDC006733]|uniref:alkyl sulfatase dimerization domain-containing protein n=1 Tax=Streptomyces sp. NPDC006733 TaxID=3155460 RepID=UPI0033DB9B36
MSGKYWLGADEGITFTFLGENSAYTEYAPTVPRAMSDHSRTMNPGVFEIQGKQVYQIYGYALSALTLVVGTDGLILIDPPEDVEKGRRQLEEIRKISDLPVKAIVYSHWHTDHYAGVKAFVSQEQVDTGECVIIAHRDFMDNVVSNNASGTGPLLTARVEYSLGSLLETGPEGRVNGGLGPDFVMRTLSLIAPTVLVDDQLEHTVAGVRMVHSWAPSEAIDEVITWFPDLGVLQSAEVIQGESFPNLHTIRGSRYRDPQQWFKSIDQHLRPLPADFMIPSHGRPVAGRAEVARVLRDYRDAISFVYDQTLRRMNQGHLPDDLAAEVTLPAHLAASEWLGDFYGGVPHSVRQVYAGEMGWFDSDPTSLNPLHPRESSRRYIDLMGGRDTVLATARTAAGTGDHQWAAELARHLVRVDTTDTDARLVKADALRQIGYTTPNSNWRNYYLTAARELDGTIDYSLKLNLDAPDQIAALPAPALLEGLRVRIDPDRAADAVRVLGVRLTDSGQEIALHVRRGVLEAVAAIPDDADTVIEVTHPIVLAMAYRDLYGAFAKAVEAGQAAVTTGTLQDVETFLSYFDALDPTPLRLSDR